AEVLGKEFATRCVPVNHSAGPVNISGWIGLPTAARAQPDQQFWFVNNRNVRDRLLMNAVRLAYRDVLYGGRHAAYVLYLTLDPKLVDVNAHPQKLEVRFRDSRQVHDFVFRALERALADTKTNVAALPAGDTTSVLGGIGALGAACAAARFHSSTLPLYEPSRSPWAVAVTVREPPPLFPLTKAPEVELEPEVEHPLGTAL